MANKAADAKPMRVADYDNVWRQRQESIGRAIADLDNQREVLISYLNAKIHVQDWHAVADAAMDLRELDAERKGLLHAG